MEVAEYLRESDDRAWRRANRVQHWVVNTLGVLTVVGWIWAIGVAFLPATAGSSGRTECGSPALVDASSATYSRDRCARVVDDRIRSAVGLTVVTLPLSAAWIWGALNLRLQRLRDADPSR
ncbi:hypothetical protein ACIBJD_13465 [Kitasatospora sp. NPDC050467]|uniref:hypothetical protein n=1 Tax=Kitasatospora sp. NPDC050467 TaxID=3364053 RepID=UPI0037B1C6F7